MTKTFYPIDTASGSVLHTDHGAWSRVSQVADPGTGSPVTKTYSPVLNGSAQYVFLFYSPSGEPDSADWPVASSGDPYKVQVEVTVAGADITYGPTTAQGGHFAVVNTGLTADLETVVVGTGQTGTGIKTWSHTSWNPAAGSSADRFEVLIGAVNANMMGQDLAINVNTSNTFLQGPWSVGPAGQSVTPGLIGPASLFAPTLSTGNVNVAPALLGGAQIFAPSQISQTVVAVLLGAAQIFSPTVAPGPVSVVLDLLGGAQTFAPSIGQSGGAQSTEPGLIGPSSLFTPTVSPGGVSVTPGLLGGSAIYGPTINAGNINVSPDLLGGSIVFAPTLTVGGVSVVPNLIGPASLYDPQISQAGGSQSTGPGLLGPSQIYAPIVVPGGVSVAPGLLGGAQTFSLTVNAGNVNIVPDRIGGAQVFAPTLGVGNVNIVPGLLGVANLFSPSVQPGMVLVASDRLGVAQLFAPTISSVPPVRGKVTTGHALQWLTSSDTKAVSTVGHSLRDNVEGTHG